MKISPAAKRDFQDKVWAYYRAHGRQFPWRDPSDTYDVLVSEVMLQQTQAERVVPKYLAFLERFPTIEALADASQSEVLQRWQGLGYNRRALNLLKLAKLVRDEHDGALPLAEAALVKLPGIGPYTAAAIAAFAGNQPSVVIETNIRAVYIHEFCGDREGVPDSELIPLIAQTVDAEDPRGWYSALMDYGAMLKKSGINPSRRSKHYTRQGPFKGSNRQIRGAVLRALMGERTLDVTAVSRELGVSPDRIRTAVEQLEREGFLTRRRGQYALA